LKKKIEDRTNAMNDIHKTYFAFGTNPYTRIIRLIGRDYNEFVKNLETLFPGAGRRVAQMLANHKQDALYSNFDVFKKRCRKRKARKVWSPTRILKFIQMDLDRLVRLQYTANTHSHGFEGGRSTRTAAEHIKTISNLNEKEVTNIDIAGAFPAITGRQIRSLLRHKCNADFTNWQINILAKIATTSNDKLATGSPCSPAFFNWRLTSLDAELEEATEARNWDFVRYADDISVVHYRTQKSSAIRLVIKLLRKLDLFIARDKLKTYRKYRKGILGLIVTPDSIEIPRQIRRTFRSILWKLAAKDYLPKNKYSLEDAYGIIKQQDQRLAFIKGTLQAQATGFAAYVIHAKRAAFRI
jgi:hypothetical protein